MYGERVASLFSFSLLFGGYIENVDVYIRGDRAILRAETQLKLFIHFSAF